MRVLTAEPPPEELEEFLERRRRFGGDRHDEMWNGVLHLSPDPSRIHIEIQQQLAVLLDSLARDAGLIPGISGFNLGKSRDDFRCPDGGIFREPSDAVWNLTAALALEIVSPDDDSWNKFDFFAAHHVDEVLIVDPQQRSVHWFALGEHGEYEPVERSRLIDLGAAQLAGSLRWPQFG